MDPATTTEIFATMVRDSKIRVSDAIWHAGRKSPSITRPNRTRLAIRTRFPTTDSTRMVASAAFMRARQMKTHRRRIGRRLRTSSFTGRPVSRAPTATPAGIVTIPQTLPCINREVSSLRMTVRAMGRVKEIMAPRQEDTMTPE